MLTDREPSIAAIWSACVAERLPTAVGPIQIPIISDTLLVHLPREAVGMAVVNGRIAEGHGVLGPLAAGSVVLPLHHGLPAKALDSIRVPIAVGAALECS